MDNIGDILSSLSDEDMKALGDAARSLLGSSEQEQGQNDSDRGFSMDPATKVLCRRFAAPWLFSAQQARLIR